MEASTIPLCHCDHLVIVSCQSKPPAAIGQQASLVELVLCTCLLKLRILLLTCTARTCRHRCVKSLTYLLPQTSTKIRYGTLYFGTDFSITSSVCPRLTIDSRDSNNVMGDGRRPGHRILDGDNGANDDDLRVTPSGLHVTYPTALLNKEDLPSQHPSNLQ